ncbi:hypothetical protein [Pseudarthrobacter albicanus]|uniref:hypothetical protein n=1 Tax=Pseudarthrobacter albicanus TaxID=2823873 RepID=UPI001BAC168D|nr:hypothetical protein [Pseudarthrobacter albicanus]
MVDAARKEPVAPVSVRELPDRGRVLCHGFIESVTYAPASKVASFIAILVDHDDAPPRPRAVAEAQRQGAARPQDRLRVIWLGRRRIPGIDAGTELRLEGMVTIRDGLPTMFNPRYEILSRQEEQ